MRGQTGRGLTDSRRPWRWLSRTNSSMKPGGSWTKPRFLESGSSSHKPWASRYIGSVTRIHFREVIDKRNLVSFCDQASGLYEYKVFGTLEDCSLELCIAVYMDLEYRKQWDQYVKELYEMKDKDKNIIYWEVKYPFPLSNRDYVYVRQLRELNINGRKICVILCRSTTSSQHPEKSGVIRVKDYKQSLAIESDGKSGSRISLHCFDNPGGMIPSWLINWASMTGVPSFLSDMQKACKNYPNKKTVSL